MMLNASQLLDVAYEALCGVGDAALGEWREVGDVAVHLRRCLSDRERRDAGDLQVEDIRGTDEQARRVERVRSFLPAAVRNRPAAEMF